MKKKIIKFISSNAFKTKNLDELIDLANHNKFKVEFSGGLNYSNNYFNQIKKLRLDKCFHNYFPIPKKSFALNLGSKNNEILNLSINHCKKAIKISNKLNLKYYSFHTPFCVDPGYLNLSKGFPANQINDYNETLDIFKNSLYKLINFNKSYGDSLKLLIENNVCSSVHNIPLAIKKKLFTFTDSNDYLDLFNDDFFNKNISILLDFAHLQVSSSVLNFDKKKHIGNVALSNISLINRSAEFSIIIGKKNNHQKKIGLNACKVIVRHGFEKLNLNRIYLGTSQNNIAMKKIAILVGMNLEGIRKSAIFLNNKYYDQYDYGILKKNYKSDKFHI